MNDDYYYNLGLKFNAVALHNLNNPAIKLLSGEIVFYRSLNELSSQVAHYLISLKVKPGDVIAIVNDKTPLAYAIMLACLKIGVIYTNLDGNSPVERIKKMLVISQPAFILVSNKYFAKLTISIISQNQVLDYSSIAFLEDINDKPNELPFITNCVSGNQPAYIMFTSGSTGFPKGVVITHANVLNFIKWSQLTYNTTTNDVFTNINPMHFDNSVFDFYASLFTGASLIPVTEELTKNPRKLIDALNTVEPTIWFSVPSMLVYVLRLRAIKDADLPTLRIVTFGGEGFPKSQLRALWVLWRNRVQFINVYGPTECTCICSSYVVSENDTNNDELLPLGPIAPNFGFIIIDDKVKIVNENEIGELLISGPNVGLGYYNDIEKTSEAFVQNPLINTYKEIVYKSGDLVRYDTKRNLLYFCGRKDNQVKRMGYRIELEEIEAALGSLSYIDENAVVFIRKEDTTGTIVACINSKFINEKKISDDLAELLPSYMLPDEFRFFDSLPKNQNGKIDRLQLKERVL